MLLILVRHVETTWNAERRLQGAKEGGISKQGRKLALKLAAYFKQRCPEVCYASSAGRALYTARKIMEACRHTKLVIDERLRECDFGIMDGARIDELRGTELWEKRMKNKYVFKHPGGESYQEQHEKRVKPFLKMLLATKYVSVLIVSHLGTNRLILAELLSMSGEQAMHIKQPHECIYYAHVEKQRADRLWHVILDNQPQQREGVWMSSRI
jgi:probable phosphoglycerate mutase